VKAVTICPATATEVSKSALPGLLFALSDATRLSIVVTLSDGVERTLNELRGEHAKSTVSHHLKVLREAGAIRVRSEGVRCFNQLRCGDLETRFPGLMHFLIDQAAAQGIGPSSPPRQNAV